MKGRRWLAAVLALACSTGCQRGAGPGGAPPEKRAAAPAASGSRSSFEPPADGRLTAAQVQMYVAVRRRALVMARSAPSAVAPERLAEIAASERRATRDLGRDLEEYLWVSARVAEASRVDTRTLGGLAGALQAAARTGREQIVEGAAARLPVAQGPAASEEPAIAYNRGLLEQHRAELEAVLPSPVLPSTAPRPAVSDPKT